MTFIVRVQPDNVLFFVNPNESILDAALRQGFDLSYGCQEGICGSCSAQLVEGKVHYPFFEPEALALDEAEAGEILLCGAVPQSDLILRHPGLSPPWMGPKRKGLYQVAHVEPMGKSLVKLTLFPINGQGLSYQAGQYVQLGLPQGEKKPFSIANAPDGGQALTFHLRVSSDNLFIQQLLNGIIDQSLVEVEGPYGKVIFHSGLNFPLIFLAGGTGFSHSQALIEKALSLNYSYPIHLFWGAKTINDLYEPTKPHEWEKILPQFRYTPFLSQQDIKGQETIVDKIIQTYPDLSEYAVFASGPPALVLEAFSRLRAIGLKRDLFFSDIFDYLPYPS